MSDPKELAEQLQEELGDETDATIEELEESFENLLNYSVPEQEALNSLRRQYGNMNGNGGGSNSDDGGSGGDPETNLEDIDTDEEWITVNVEVVDLWEPRSDAISQVGLVGDETDTMKFVAFSSSEIDTELEEGTSYKLSPVVTDEYQGRFSIKLNRQTDITKLDENIEVDDGSMDISIPIVDVQDGSGLIKRCPVSEGDNDDDTCGRPIRNGRCNEHGEVDGEFDLRIKAVGDNGTETVDILFNRETTEALTGMTLDEAKQMAQDAMDTSVVMDDISEQIVGNYYHITGRKPGDYLLVETCDPVDTDTKTEAQDMLNEVGA